MSDDRTSAVLRILRAGRDEAAKKALSGAATGGAALALTGDARLIAGAAGVGAVVGAVGGGVAGAGAQLRRETLPTAGELIDDADEDATAEASRAVPALASRVGDIERADASTRTRLDELTAALGVELQAAHRARIRERTLEVGRMLLSLVADGHATPEEIDSAEGRESIAEVIRFSLDALRPEAVPMIARLAARPVDHFFRGSCRVLVDLSTDELRQLAALVGSAARAIPSYVTRADRMSPDNPQLDWTRSHLAEITDLELDRDSLAGTSDTVLRWNFLDDAPEGIRIARDSALVSLLVAHRLAEATPNFTGRVSGDIEGGSFHVDNRVLVMTIDRLLDFHFVLTGERIVDPRSATAPVSTAGDE